MRSAPMCSRASSLAWRDAVSMTVFSDRPEDSRREPRAGVGQVLRVNDPSPRGAFTLLEVLIALSLLVLLVGLTLPAIGDRVRKAEFEAACRDFQSSFAVARAESQRRSEALRFIAAPAGRGRLGLFIEPITSEGAADNFEVVADEQANSADPSPLESEPEVLRSRRILLATLPSRLRITSTQPTPELFGPAGSIESAAAPAMPDIDTPAASDLPTAEPSPPDEPLQEIAIAILLPDGGAIYSQPRYLALSASLVRKLQINAWTGVCTLEPIPVDPQLLGEDPQDDADESATRSSMTTQPGGEP